MNADQNISPSNIGEALDDIYKELERFSVHRNKLSPPLYLQCIIYMDDENVCGLGGWVFLKKWHYIVAYTDDKTYIDGVLC